MNNELFPEEKKDVEIKIDYEDFLTPEQTATFYQGLKEILDELNIKDVRFVIEKGSLKTVIKGILLYMIAEIMSAFTNPTTPIQLKNAFNFTNVFNNTNFSFIAINETTIYDKENIKEKNEEYRNKLNESENKQKDETIEIESLQMIISSKCTTTKIKEREYKTIKKEDIQFTAKFDDIRYKDVNYEIKVISHKNDIQQANNNEIISSYFIADGKLTKSNGKYTRFEITNLTKTPTKHQLELPL